MARYTTTAIDMLDFFERQMEWSYETFGPPDHRGPAGPLDHLLKEATEAINAPTEEALKTEIIDCLFLVFDAAHRAGMGYGEIARRAMSKLAINKDRVWPDWRTAPKDKAVEHDRTTEGDDV